MMNGNGSGDQSRDLETDDTIKDPVEDRRTLAERNERLHDQLKVGTISGVNRYTRVQTPIFIKNNNNNNNNNISKKTIVDSEIRYAAQLCVLHDPRGNIKFQSSRFVVRYNGTKKFLLHIFHFWNGTAFCSHSLYFHVFRSFSYVLTDTFVMKKKIALIPINQFTILTDL